MGCFIRLCTGSKKIKIKIKIKRLLHEEHEGSSRRTRRKLTKDTKKAFVGHAVFFVCFPQHAAACFDVVVQSFSLPAIWFKQLFRSAQTQTAPRGRSLHSSAEKRLRL
jgi:hypothetical protein